MQFSQKQAKLFSSNRIIGTACLAAILWGGSAAASPASRRGPQRRLAAVDR